MNALNRLILALSLALPLAAFGQAEPDDPDEGTLPDAPYGGPGPLEEVVVSEFRRETPLELDSSVTVLGRETVREAALQHFEELVELVPNMNWSGEGSRARYFQLRGVGELEQYEGAPNPSVGFIIDDIDLSGANGVLVNVTAGMDLAIGEFDTVGKVVKTRVVRWPRPNPNADPISRLPKCPKGAPSTMIGIRCHNPQSLTFHCRPRAPTMPVRVHYQETADDAPPLIIRTRASHPAGQFSGCRSRRSHMLSTL